MRSAGKIVPIILAAGAANGISDPQALSKFRDRTALEIAVSNCAHLETAVVVLGSQSQRVLPHVPASARVVVNQHWQAGQMSSLRAALAAIAPGCDFMVYPVDYPLLTGATIDKLAAGFQARSAEQTIAIPRFRGRGGHPVIFAAELRAEFQEAQTAREIVYRDPHRVKFVTCATEAIWRDLDSAASYRARVREYEKNA